MAVRGRRAGKPRWENEAARCRVLASLFTVRTAFAFQFQAVGALSPLFVETYCVSLTETGLLMGLYLALGIASALPRGPLASRFGDRTIVLDLWRRLSQQRSRRLGQARQRPDLFQ